MSDAMHAEEMNAPGDTLRLVGFRIEDWRFAIRLAQVRTALIPCPITRVYHLPDYVRGIISLRGTIVGVLDLGRLLGLSRATGSFQRLLVVSGSGVQAAIPVHDVFRIPDVPASLVGGLPSSLSAAQKQYLEGIINTSGLDGWSGGSGEDTITLIDAEVLFGSQAVRDLRGSSVP